MLLYDSARIWIIESPNNAPHANENKNLMVISKQVKEQNFLTTKSIIAAINPISEIANPAKKPKPHIWASFKCTISCAS